MKKQSYSTYFVVQVALVWDTIWLALKSLA